MSNLVLQHQLVNTTRCWGSNDPKSMPNDARRKPYIEHFSRHPWHPNNLKGQGCHLSAIVIPTLNKKAQGWKTGLFRVTSSEGQRDGGIENESNKWEREALSFRFDVLNTNEEREEASQDDEDDAEASTNTRSDLIEDDESEWIWRAARASKSVPCQEQFRTFIKRRRKLDHSHRVPLQCTL